MEGRLAHLDWRLEMLDCKFPTKPESIRVPSQAPVGDFQRPASRPKSRFYERFRSPATFADPSLPDSNPVPDASPAARSPLSRGTVVARTRCHKMIFAGPRWVADQRRPLLDGLLRVGMILVDLLAFRFESRWATMKDSYSVRVFRFLLAEIRPRQQIFKLRLATATELPQRGGDPSALLEQARGTNVARLPRVS
jgi:hypothetical protein